MEIHNNKLLPDIAIGIASVSPIIGCKAGCAYCYLGLRKAFYPVENCFGIKETVQYLLENPKFKKGKEGTIICLGGWGEMFPRSADLRNASIKWIQQLTELENPIVIFTKASLSDDEIAKLVGFQIYEKQILLLLSITCIHNYRDVEPNTDDPIDRLESLYRCCTANLYSGILLNPFLRKYSEADYEELISYLKRMPVYGLVVSPLFYNKVLLEKFRKNMILSPICDRIKDQEVKNRLHMSNEEFRVYAEDISDLYEYIFSISKQNGIHCWKHYSCLIMNFFHQYNSDIFRKELCNCCGHCVTFLS